MNNISALPTVKDKLSETAATELRELLRRSEKGEIVSFSAVIWLQNGDFETISSACESRLKTAGALMQLIIDRLGERE